MYDAGGTIAQRLVAKYTLAGIPHDPMTMMAAGSLALGVVGAGVSAAGTLGAGNASQQAAQMSAAATKNAGELTAQAQETTGELSARAQETTGELSARAQETGGAIAKRISDVQAKQLEQNAGTTRAQGQRQAFDLNSQTRLALSTLRARAAGSGLSATGASPIAVARQIGSRGTYLSLTAMANGEISARGLEDQAFATHMSGEAQKYGADVGALGTRYGATVGALGTRTGSKMSAFAARAGAEASAAADLFKGDAAKTASQFAAAGTLASGLGSSLSNFGKVMYPTPTGKAGV
jgi:hypothetical protein